MHFVGLDLAWGQRKPTGVAVVDDTGKLLLATAVTDDASIRGILEPYTEGDCLVSIDAPLIVTNPTGQRPGSRGPPASPTTSISTSTSHPPPPAAPSRFTRTRPLSRCSGWAAP